MITVFLHINNTTLSTMKTETLIPKLDEAAGRVFLLLLMEQNAEKQKNLHRILTLLKAISEEIQSKEEERQSTDAKNQKKTLHKLWNEILKNLVKLGMEELSELISDLPVLTNSGLF